jgi:hypothetical protein
MIPDQEHSIASAERGSKPTILWGSILAVVVLGGLLWFFFLRSASPRRETNELPFGPAEQVYSSRIGFSGLEMSRAANFINQEVTYLSGSVENQGDRGIREIEVTIEFRDVLNQVVLRETRRVLGQMGGHLAPGEKRDFRIAFDHVPADWNVQIPALRISGLDLE